VRLSPEDEVSLRRVSDLAISPAGDEIVYAIAEVDLLANTRSSRLWRQSLAEGHARPLTAAWGLQRLPRYSPDGRTIAFVANNANRDQLMVVPATGGRPGEALPQDALLVRSEIFGTPGDPPSFSWSPDSREIACLVRAGDVVAGDLSVEGPRPTGDPAVTAEITERSRGGPPVLVCIVDPMEKRVRMVGQAERPLGFLTWSADGQYLYAVSRARGETVGEVRFDLLRFSVDGEPVTTLHTFYGAAFRPTLSKDGRHFAVSAARGTTNAPGPCLLVLSADGSTARELSQDDRTTFSDLHWTADDTFIVAVADAGLGRELLRIDVSSAETTKLCASSGWIESLRCSQTSDVLAYIQSAPDQPADIWLHDAGSARRVTNINPHTSAFEFAHGEVFTWQAGDGTPLEGLLLYPPGYQPGSPQRLIIDYHGGPASHVTLGWNGLRQVLASAGYVVFAPNFRGSTGYGADFSNALRGDIGGVPYTDSLEGIDSLVAQGIADPDRLFAYGHSWGGFMTNWTATHSNRFKAIVSSGSICDLLSVFHTRYSADVWEWRLLGSPAKSFEQYVKWSPVLYADQVTAPVLFLNGAEDRTTPPTQGLEMFTAVRQRGIRSEHVVYPREGHAITEPRHQVDRARRILDWFDI
jgi:dipeptidyl aminopeptidase/acylaminoacyl peptidase